MTTDRRFKAALVQLRSGRSLEANLAEAERLVREAAAAGAHYIQTPENTGIMELDRALLFAAVAPGRIEPAVARLRALAKNLGVWLHIGSLALQVAEGKLANRSLLIAPDGRIAASYDKIHMFDVDLAGGERYRESERFEPGTTAVVCTTPFASIGLTICYDLRFPALYRTLAEAGAEIIAVPSAFTRQTGEAHWDVLLRARAIETGCYVLAAAQGGRHQNGRETHGHSIAISPWGEVLAQAGSEPGVILAEIDLAAVRAARQKIPALEHARPFTVVRHGQAETSGAAS